jgi:hypothetical protein
MSWLIRMHRLVKTRYPLQIRGFDITCDWTPSLKILDFTRSFPWIRQAPWATFPIKNVYLIKRLLSSKHVFKKKAFWDLTPCSLMEVDRHFRGAYFFWNVGLLLRDYTAPYPRMPPCSYSPPWEPKISRNTFYFNWFVAWCSRSIDIERTMWLRIHTLFTLKEN